MIEKQFQNPFTYYLIKAGSMVFLMIFLSYFLFLGLIGTLDLKILFGLTAESYREALMIIPFILLMLSIFFYLTLGLRNKMAISILKRIDPLSNPLDLIADERILIPKSPCLIKGISIVSVSRFPRHIIVTNFRITIGFLNSISLIFKGKREETLGLMNLWHPSIEKIPETASKKGFLDDLGKTLGANTKITDIAYGSNSGGPFVIIRLKGFPMYYTIYHPEARSIYDSFSGNR